MKGRLAPSPTGPLHLGGAATFLLAYARARTLGGGVGMRVEDLDTPRVVAGAEAALLDDLAWLGIGWEGPIVRQSTRTAAYEAAIEVLRAAGRVYACDCSRKEVALVASAPHPGEELRYPGTCRDAPAHRPMRRPPALRFRTEPGDVERFVDAACGPLEEDVHAAAGDFVLRRGDGVFAYQLAVVVDDLAMGVEEIVRGADLLGSTARQRLLARLLGGAPPATLHGPLFVGPGGERLAKRSPSMTIAGLRAAGVAAETVVGALAASLGLTETGRPLAARELAVDPARVRTGTVEAPTLG